MALGRGVVAAARVLFHVEHGQMSAGLQAAERQVQSSTARMRADVTTLTDAQIRAELAQRRYNEAVERFGPTSSRALAATLKLRSAQAELAGATEASAAAAATATRSWARFDAAMVGSAAGMQKAGRALKTHLMLPMLAVAGASVKFSIDFEKQMRLIEVQAGATREEMERMTKEVLAFARSGESESGPAKLAQALFHIESVGLRGAAAMAALEAAEKGASVGASDLEETTNALTGAYMSGIRGIGDFEKTMATLNATVGAGNLRMDQLTAALGTGILPIADRVGISLAEVGASLGVMTSKGIPAEDAATKLKTTLALLAAPTDKAKESLKELGIGGDELARTIRGPGGFEAGLRLIQDGMRNVGDSTRATEAVLTAFGRGRSGVGILVLTKNVDDYSARIAQIKRETADFHDAVERQGASAAHKLGVAWAQTQAALISLGAIITPVVTGLARVVGGLARAFEELPGPAKSGVAIIVGLLAVGGPLLLGLAAVVRAVRLIATTFGLVGPAAVSAAATTNASMATLGGSAAVAGTKARGLLGTLRSIAKIAAVGIGIELLLKPPSWVERYSGSKGWANLWRDITGQSDPPSRADDVPRAPGDPAALPGTASGGLLGPVPSAVTVGGRVLDPRSGAVLAAGATRAFPFAAGVSASNLGGVAAHMARSGQGSQPGWQSDRAVDIAVVFGTPVLAIESGRILKAHNQGFSGTTAGWAVTLAGDSGDQYFYAHLASVVVQAGDRVKIGQTLGKSGSAVGVPHLHLGQMSGNPESVFSFARPTVQAVGAVGPSAQAAREAAAQAAYHGPEFLGATGGQTTGLTGAELDIAQQIAEASAGTDKAKLAALAAQLATAKTRLANAKAGSQEMLDLLSRRNRIEGEIKAIHDRAAAASKAASDKEKAAAEKEEAAAKQLIADAAKRVRDNIDMFGVAMDVPPAKAARIKAFTLAHSLTDFLGPTGGQTELAPLLRRQAAAAQQADREAAAQAAYHGPEFLGATGGQAAIPGLLLTRAQLAARAARSGGAGQIAPSFAAVLASRGAVRLGRPAAEVGDIYDVAAAGQIAAAQAAGRLPGMAGLLSRLGQLGSGRVLQPATMEGIGKVLIPMAPTIDLWKQLRGQLTKKLKAATSRKAALVRSLAKAKKARFKSKTLIETLAASLGQITATIGELKADIQQAGVALYELGKAASDDVAKQAGEAEQIAVEALSAAQAGAADIGIDQRIGLAIAAGTAGGADDRAALTGVEATLQGRLDRGLVDVEGGGTAPLSGEARLALITELNQVRGQIGGIDQAAAAAAEKAAQAVRDQAEREAAAREAAREQAEREAAAREAALIALPAGLRLQIAQTGGGGLDLLRQQEAFYQGGLGQTGNIETQITLSSLLQQVRAQIADIAAQQARAAADEVARRDQEARDRAQAARAEFAEREAALVRLPAEVRLAAAQAAGDPVKLRPVLERERDFFQAGLAAAQDIETRIQLTEALNSVNSQLGQLVSGQQQQIDLLRRQLEETAFLTALRGLREFQPTLLGSLGVAGTINVQNFFAASPEDPRTFVKSLEFELRSLAA